MDIREGDAVTNRIAKALCRNWRQQIRIRAFDVVDSFVHQILIGEGITMAVIVERVTGYLNRVVPYPRISDLLVVLNQRVGVDPVKEIDERVGFLENGFKKPTAVLRRSGLEKECFEKQSISDYLPETTIKQTIVGEIDPLFVVLWSH